MEDNTPIHQNLSKITNHEFTKKTNYINLHQDIAQTPQDKILIELIGLYNTTSQGNSYALTAVCNLTGYPMTTPVPGKKTATVVIHLFLEMMLKFSFPRILHSTMEQNLTLNLLNISHTNLI